ncbi:Carotenoid cleavage oxygenase [Actinosynnema sp. ALI-1.44]
MSSRTRNLAAVAPLPLDRLGPADELPVRGALPGELRGCFLQSGPRPPAGEEITGVRIGDGVARWYRTQDPEGCLPAGPVPALAPRVRPAASGTKLLAHPVQDPTTREWHTIATTPGSAEAEHLVMATSGAVSRGRSFALGAPTLVTTLALTRDHVVVFDLSLVHDHAAELRGLRHAHAWRADKPARLGLLPRTPGSGELRWFPVRPGATFRALNAFQDGGTVVVDALRHDGPLDAEPAPRPYLGRWTLDLGTGAVTERRVIAAVDSATTDPAACGREHRHVFGTTGRLVFHHDLQTSTSDAFDLGAGRRGGQPVFVGGTTGEWLLVFADNLGRRGSEVLVFDARRLGAGPRASVLLPGAVPAADRATWQPFAEHGPL